MVRNRRLQRSLHFARGSSQPCIPACVVCLVSSVALGRRVRVLRCVSEVAGMDADLVQLTVAVLERGDLHRPGWSLLK
eukprot:12165176-Alexandrium_andersonii.AAC.1